MSNSHEHNSFDALRLLAACTVIFDHSYLRGGEHHHALAFIGIEDIGGAAVDMFFAISGYLVTQSWLRDPSLPRFLLRRFLRIFPALIAVVTLCALLVGPVMTELSFDDYIHNPDTWAYFKNITMRVQPHTLPGLFTHNPDIATVNGPLWSLPYELLCYALVAMAGVAGIFRFRLAGASVAFGILAYYLYTATGGGSAGEVRENVPAVLAFLTGMVMASEKKFCASPFAFPVLGLVLVATVYTTHMYYAPVIVIAIATIAVGQRVALPLKNDYSYGLYLWGYVVEQMLALRLRSCDDMSFYTIALCLAFVPAALSWHLVEKPALRLKPARVMEN